ncbi:MAG: hypothetical protein QG608_3742 [Actinomycetota bacterium]|nr:hypothetical protein [Actinomycetota bacterium]
MIRPPTGTPPEVLAPLAAADPSDVAAVAGRERLDRGLYSEPGSRTSSWWKYQAEQTSTAAPIPATTSTITRWSGPMANARSSPSEGTQLTVSVLAGERVIAPVRARDHATAAPGTSARRGSARRQLFTVFSGGAPAPSPPGVGPGT